MTAVAQTALMLSGVDAKSLLVALTGHLQTQTGLMISWEVGPMSSRRVVGWSLHRCPFTVMRSSWGPAAVDERASIRSLSG
ncbi:hypothetical protein NDU88_002183 [Pleurodeles waltl]|uniref:Uncharacterized protein n=1 Tax=Pleurodeles waltl TaxID=8319 RepID=A0AAV7LNL4_PLEWA|nr:hypothetical protein NDU88_002183 [Pleurodeles waltl]